MNEYVTSLARHILTALCGALVAKGTIDESTVEPIVGAVIGLVGYAWSAMEKKKRKF